jgi:hypothetical protein
MKKNYYISNVIFILALILALSCGCGKTETYTNIQTETVEESITIFDKLDNIEYHFIGPSELECDFKEDRIKFYGTIDYNELYFYIKDFDCLIVPFKLDDKIRSADPGKIYGYINYDKPIISVYYEELKYFAQFLYFYQNVEDLIELLNKLIITGFVKKYSNSERKTFLKNNSWKIRGLMIRKHLDSIDNNL